MPTNGFEGIADAKRAFADAELVFDATNASSSAFLRFTSTNSFLSLLIILGARDPFELEMKR